MEKDITLIAADDALGRIENPAFLIFVKEIQKSRSEDNKLNVFDLMALYKTAKGMSHRNTDSETLNKLLREGLLIESEEGLKTACAL